MLSGAVPGRADLIDARLALLGPLLPRGRKTGGPRRRAAVAH
ncbi:hypothetical protein BTZ20_4629 [Rhodococcus sp. MTM3W5.2]|nr:hypothetical protein BTZ20_4629 [Rhodococcus sp. MTM3W5.2]